jgi:hypothetical protein
MTISAQFAGNVCSEHNDKLLEVIDNHERMIRRLEKVIDIQGKRITEMERSCGSRAFKTSEDVPLFDESTIQYGSKARHRKVENGVKILQVGVHSDKENQRIQRLLIGMQNDYINQCLKA